MGSNRKRKAEAEDVDALYANIMASSPGEQARESISSAAKRRAEEKRSKREQYKRRQKRLALTEQQYYQRKVLELERSHSANQAPMWKRVRLALPKSPKFKLPRIGSSIFKTIWAGLKWTFNKIPLRLRLAALTLALAVLVFTVALALFGKDQAPADNWIVTPAKVYVPPKLPEGFTTAGGTETLENGARLYTVYDDKGNAITITQQSRPANFDTSIFGNDEGVNTPLGTAYIVKTDDRTTGYVVAKETMLLFNAPPNIEGQSLYDLMRTFEP